MSPRAQLNNLLSNPDVIIDDGVPRVLSQYEKMEADPARAAEQWAGAMVKNLFDFAAGESETYNGVVATSLPWHNQVNEAYQRQLKDVFGEELDIPDPAQLPPGTPYTVLRDRDLGVNLTMKAFGQEDGNVHTIWYAADRLGMPQPNVRMPRRMPISVTTLLNQLIPKHESQ